MDKIIRNILTKIESNGYEAYLIGGYVRDLLVGKTTYDIDITTNATPRELLEISKKLELEYATKYLNQTVEVLIEEQKEAYSIGHTGNYLHIKINKLLPKNTFVKVKITKIDYPYCIAE